MMSRQEPVLVRHDKTRPLDNDDKRPELRSMLWIRIAVMRIRIQLFLDADHAFCIDANPVFYVDPHPDQVQAFHFDADPDPVFPK